MPVVSKGTSSGNELEHRRKKWMKSLDILPTTPKAAAHPPS